MKRFFVFAGGLVCTVVVASGAQILEEWWTGTQGTGDWLGARPVLADHGLSFFGWWGADYTGVVDGGVSCGGTFEEELYFGATLDAAKATGAGALEGLTFTGGVRWRDGANSNIYAGDSPVFSPSLYQSGMGWRMMPFYATYVTPELFGVPKLLTLSGGWQNPYNFFVQQDASKLFRNNMIASSKGITANGVGWSSSYAAWGGFLKVQPVNWYYAQAGMYLAIPGGADSANHGLDFAGARPARDNGIFLIGETGFTPKIGPSKLPGKYALGGYSWGLEASAYTGEIRDNRWGLYWQADQMIWREPSASDGKAVADGKSFAKNVAEPTLRDEGLSLFSYFYFAPEKENALPFYYQAGAVYKGLLPTRGEDRLAAVIGMATYSGGFVFNDEEGGVEYAKDYEGVIEVDYRFQVNRWAYIQPFVQYLIRPGGTDSVANATAIGVHFQVQF